MAIQGTEFVRFLDLKMILNNFIKDFNHSSVEINSDVGVWVNGQPIVVASDFDFKEYLGIQ